MARPTKLTPEVADTIIDAIRDGGFAVTAAHRAGISEQTYYAWCKRGLSGEQPFAEFLERLKRAGAEAQASLLGLIRHAAERGTWQAAAWILERRWPTDWGRQPRTITEQERQEIMQSVVAKMDRALDAAGVSQEQRRVIGEHILSQGGDEQLGL